MRREYRGVHRGLQHLIIYIEGDNGTSLEGTLKELPTKWRCSIRFRFLSKLH